MSDMPCLPWVTSNDPFPAPEHAWPHTSEAPGLLAASRDINSAMLLRAYQAGIFPWYSPGQPVLWWMPAPRTMLRVGDFRIHRSFNKTLRRFQSNMNCEIRMDSSFRTVMEACAAAPRIGQQGTWITPAIIDAYVDLHRLGHAHSVETWIDNQLVGGLYCVNIGKAVFGESMFARETDASKIALAALVSFCQSSDIPIIDCQQKTRHLVSLGATEFSRSEVHNWLQVTTGQSAPHWTFEASLWRKQPREYV